MWPTAILQSISAALVGEKKQTFFSPSRLLKNTHACSSLLKVSSQQVVGLLDNKAVMAGEWCLIRDV